MFADKAINKIFNSFLKSWNNSGFFYICKMKNKIFLALGASLLSYGLIYYFKIKDFISKVKIELQNIVIDTEQTKQSNFKYLYYTVNFVIINPVNFSIFIENILCNIYFFNNKIGAATSTKKIKIEPKKILIVPIKLKLELETLPLNIAESLIQSINEKEFVLNLTGKINFEMGSINFKFIKKVK